MKFLMPTEVYFEEQCITSHKEVFSKCGKKALIVTGRHSAKACGAYEDITKALDSQNVQYVLFDQIENNPSVETVEQAAAVAKKEKVDFVIGVGGGSPIDASKAIAVLAANPKMQGKELFKNGFTQVLPIVAIPTTAGTGSEVTPYSVLLCKDLQTKVSFGTPKTFPAYALLDAKYTMTLSQNSTVSTAVDAFTHVMEGYLANRSTWLSDALAQDGIKAFGKSLKNLAEFKLTPEDRKNLMYVSLLGGMVIAQTGVTIAHGMGYCYTFFKGIPHGKANGLIMREYLKLNSSAAGDKIKKALELLGCSTIDEFADILYTMLGPAPILTEEEIQKYTELTQLQKGSMSNNPYPIDAAVIRKLWSNIR